jgi:quercetin dioxygenase-like cupin family protein
VTTTKKDIERLHEQAALHALEVLPADEARVLETELTADATLRDELSTLRSVADDLAYAAPAHPPPPALRARLLARIAAAEQAVIDHDGVRFVRSGELDWRPGSGPGFEVKPLFADPSGRRTTTIVRMAPGTTYANHRHADIEELFLLEGDLLVSGVLMRPGDYCRAEADTVHEGIMTPSGCVFIVSASERDELFT